VEGSNSLYKIIKNDASAKKDRFMSHCFQEIDARSPLASQDKGEKGKGFESVDANGNNGFLPDSENASAENSARFEDLKESAYTEGFMKGEEAGTESERKRLQTIFDTFDKAISELWEIKEDLCLNIERGSVELALAIAEKVVFHEVSVNKETLLGVLKGALEKVVDQEKIKIRINKLDLQFINESGYQISGLTDNPKDVIIEGTDTISRGGCVIETGFGSIDARIESQLQAVGDLLRSEMP
jgi:flagellar assembly protein FliH